MKRFGWQVVGCSMPAMQRQERHGHQELIATVTGGTTSVMVVDERRWRYSTCKYTVTLKPGLRVRG